MSTCVLVAASDFNKDQFIYMQEAGMFNRIIAVDAGYDRLRSVGVVPDLAVGDFDSLGFVPTDCEIEEFPVQKDMSDLEIALCRAKAAGADRIVVFGAMGGRLDHTFANIQLLARFAEVGSEVVAVGTDCALSYVVGPGTMQLPSGREGTVSVFSLTPMSRGVSEMGLEYSLELADLPDRTTWGLSNELKGQAASISVERGTLVVFFPLSCLH